MNPSGPLNPFTSFNVLSQAGSVLIFELSRFIFVGKEFHVGEMLFGQTLPTTSPRQLSARSF